MARQEHMDDEVNLMDYIRVIIKRKKIIIGVVIICVVVTIVTNLQKLTVSSTVRIGSIEGSLYSTDEVIEKMKNRNSLQSIVSETGVNLTAESLSKSIKIENISGTNFIIVQLESIKPDLAVKILNKMGNKFILDGNKLYENQIALMKQQVQALHMQTEVIGRQMKSLDEKMSKGKSRFGYASVHNTLATYGSVYSELSKAEYSLKKSLLTAENFEIVELPSESTNITSIKNKQKIIPSAILGLMLGIFIAFFKDYWERNANKETEKS